jgi:hypothetical protein
MRTDSVVRSRVCSGNLPMPEGTQRTLQDVLKMKAFASNK